MSHLLPPAPAPHRLVFAQKKDTIFHVIVFGVYEISELATKSCGWGSPIYLGYLGYSGCLVYLGYLGYSGCLGYLGYLGYSGYLGYLSYCLPPNPVGGAHQFT